MQEKKSTEYHLFEMATERLLGMVWLNKSVKYENL